MQQSCRKAKRKLKRGSLVRIRTRNEIPSRYRYNPVTPEWQRQACQLLGLQFVCDNGYVPGGSAISLTYPRTVQRIQGDGNCLYRALVYAITGSESQHYRLRCLIVEHLRSLTGTEQELRLHGSLIGNYDTVEEYIVHSQMDQLGSWGSEVEMALLAHRLGINVASFNARVGDYAM